MEKGNNLSSGDNKYKHICIRFRASKLIKQTLLYLKAQINHKRKIVDDFNTTLSKMKRSSGPKILSESNDSIDQMGLMDIYRIFHQTTIGYIFFLEAYGMILKINHILGHKTSFNKYKENNLLYFT
jgi:hypothetical protein